MKQPVLRYESGDSVSLTISESSTTTPDFNHLIGNHPRVCNDFYAFAPQLIPQKATTHDSIKCPVLALQVTLFPGKGLCMGFAAHHAVVDASTVASFTRAWALINTRDANNICEINKWLPFYDRKNITNLNGLDSIYWDVISKEFASSMLDTPKSVNLFKLIRATFVLKKDEIERLKNFVLTNCPSVAHFSSFSVVCALVWVCLAKSAEAGGEKVGAVPKILV
ncbi:hypothetical protein BUALT_Bualt14G0007700 [Buddleja alternifolia]|uniref:Uncharacterized protein n=1 Tax=Buddleja alternifolia TaxID=168488 RepID=A0AAV6WR12_9LAMI|nr:hypothetical protein BUALT_Bualt14G0007700 [Buddleja alternifolia]